MQISKCSIKGALNDLWVYDIIKKTWRWISGSSTINSRGIFGVKGQPNAVNRPGSRLAPCLIFDQEANALHLIFGYGYTTILSMLF